MSLPDSQQRILDGIEERLSINDSRLTTLFATFGRLTGQEEMPVIEQITRRPRWEGVLRGRRQRQTAVAWAGGPAEGPVGGLGPRFRWLSVVPFAIFAVLGVLVIALLAAPHQSPCSANTGSKHAGISMSAPTHCVVRHSPFMPG